MLANIAVTTTTVAAKHGAHNALGFGGGSLVKWAVVVGLAFLLIAVLVSMRPTDKVSKTLGGKVIGIVGRMGSGKTYMAVQIAYDHLVAGHEVRTNFTMVLPDECKERWAYFTGWDQFADLDNCVVVIDEAQLYAPSYKPLAFPLIARWKLAMARKFKLDVYWISQHEDRVNSTLKHLTNLIYVCNAWLGGAYFSAKGYEPEYVRRKGKHLVRRSYRFKLEKAQLYDTLEVLTPDEHLGDEKVLAKLDKIGDLALDYNDKRSMSKKRGQSVDEVLDMARAHGLDTTMPKPEAPKLLGFTLGGKGKKCHGMAEGGRIKCGRATTNANGLCDECIARAKASLRVVRN